ncbi:MAG: acyl-CoA dehydratase activase [Syntrophorhabdaceae bacterium]|nr:acyl-CoA dehydratase activase [Syntrophorhabdaceae bacterium]
MGITLGIDIGSSFSKAVLYDGVNVLSYTIIPSGGDFRVSARRATEDVLTKAGLRENEIVSVASTGYGASLVEISNRTISDIVCHATAIHSLFPSVMTIIDVGAQFSKAIRLDREGHVVNFLMSEKCAGGSGKFFQLISKILKVDIGDIGELSLKSTNPVQFTTGCAVFAESEAISRIAEGALVEDILAGVNQAMASKIQGLIMRLGISENCAITGGGAKNKGLVLSTEKLIGLKLLVPDEPRITAALGAAIIAYGASL